jgi:hypothetical protein
LGRLEKAGTCPELKKTEGLGNENLVYIFERQSPTA